MKILITGAYGFVGKNLFVIGSRPKGGESAIEWACRCVDRLAVAKGTLSKLGGEKITQVGIIDRAKDSHTF